MDKIHVSEEQKIHEQWYANAKHVTMETLPTFLNKLVNDYSYDYGTICHAISAGAIATATALNNSNIGGITGFQASFVMWGFIQHWMKESNKCGLRLVDYDDMLYPQYESKLDKTISASTWESIQKEAKARLETDSSRAHEAVVAHWKSIVDGVVPFGYTVKND